MSKKVYIVVSGEYSDYGIDAVFDNKKRAEKFIKFLVNSKMDIDSPRIEEWPLNPYINEMRRGYKFYFVRMQRTGDVCEITTHNRLTSRTKPTLDINNNMYLYCFARDEKHAIKIANEKRVQLIAMNAWPEK